MEKKKENSLEGLTEPRGEKKNQVSHCQRKKLQMSKEGNTTMNSVILD